MGWGWGWGGGEGQEAKPREAYVPGGYDPSAFYGQFSRRSSHPSEALKFVMSSSFAKSKAFSNYVSTNWNISLM